MSSHHLGSWPSPGPLETAPFPDQLTARVTTAGAQPRIHGYDVETDLAQHYSPSEVAFLAITGDLPSPQVAAALDAILVFAAPVSIACAPTHAAVLARLCGATASSIVSVAVIGLAEQVRELLDRHEELLAWLTTRSGPAPERCLSTSGEVMSVTHLRAVLDKCGLRVAALRHELTPEAALLASLYACGITSRDALEVLLVWARLPAVTSEALAETVANFKNYPANLPAFTYDESAL